MVVAFLCGMAGLVLLLGILLIPTTHTKESDGDFFLPEGE